MNFLLPLSILFLISDLVYAEVRNSTNKFEYQFGLQTSHKTELGIYILTTHPETQKLGFYYDVGSTFPPYRPKSFESTGTGDSVYLYRKVTYWYTNIGLTFAPNEKLTLIGAMGVSGNAEYKQYYSAILGSEFTQRSQTQAEGVAAGINIQLGATYKPYPELYKWHLFAGYSSILNNLLLGFGFEL